MSGDGSPLSGYLELVNKCSATDARECCLRKDLTPVSSPVGKWIQSRLENGLAWTPDTSIFRSLRMASLIFSLLRIPPLCPFFAQKIPFFLSQVFLCSQRTIFFFFAEFSPIIDFVAGCGFRGVKLKYRPAPIYTFTPCLASSSTRPARFPFFGWGRGCSIGAGRLKLEMFPPAKEEAF